MELLYVTRTVQAPTTGSSCQQKQLISFIHVFVYNYILDTCLFLSHASVRES